MHRWKSSDRLREALGYAEQLHGAQLRKGTAIPYLSELRTGLKEAPPSG